MLERSNQFEKCKSYIISQTKKAEKEGAPPTGSNPAITLSRETGAGALTLGEKLAEYLNQHAASAHCSWTVFDKNLVEKVLEDHDLPARLGKFMPEDRPSTLEDAFGDILGTHPPNWDLVKHTQDTIYRLARMGNCILVGRGASIIAEDLPNVLRVRLVGSLEKRVIRCMDYYGIDEEEARKLVRKQDRARRRYVLAYYDREIADPLNYHLVINVDLFSSEAIVKLIGDTISHWSV
jgi:cytidylate kinase